MSYIWIIGGNKSKTCLVNWQMGFVVPGIVNSVHGDDWTGDFSFNSSNFMVHDNKILLEWNSF